MSGFEFLKLVKYLELLWLSIIGIMEFVLLAERILIKLDKELIYRLRDLIFLWEQSR